jgi:beta-phosphoglucomutase-like phosphatase (HAD superfamily)
MTQSVSFDKLHAVLFDMDGLIVDTEPIHFKAFQAYMQRFEVDLPESVMPEFLGYTEEDNLRDLREQYELDKPLREMVAERGAIYLELVRTEPLRVFPGFWELCEEARGRGMKLGVVSSANRQQVEIVLGRLLEEHREGETSEAFFDVVVTGDDIAKNKPAPEIYLLAAERLGVPPALCLAFEDTPPGVQSAAAAGMCVLAVPNEYSRGLKFPGAVRVIESLKEGVGFLGF